MEQQKRRVYLRKSEKDEVMAISSLAGCMNQSIDRIDKFYPEQKDYLKNMRKAKTFLYKGLESLFSSLDLDVLKDVKSFVDTKQVFILDPADAKVIRSRIDSEENSVNIEIKAFVNMSIQIRNEMCKNCDGKCADTCSVKKILIVNCPIDGSKEYINCPFAEKEEK